jgi:O-6-methylguanine DNA methyltransferase
MTLRFTTIRLDPIGPFVAAYTDAGLCFLNAALQGEEAVLAEVRERFGQEPVRDDSQQLFWQKALADWAAGAVQPVPLDLSRVSPFDRRVMEVCARIPRGEVRPYSWLAREVGSPKASRAVGNVMARNPIPLFIPCHRVVTASGHLGNFGMGGPHLKRLILALEGADVERLEELARQGYRFVANPATGTYCYPSCRIGRQDSGRGFRSAAEAEAAGWRPCPACRP